jgi:tRNA threonylcarbamoyl adenosine modification protein YeaZ
MLIIGIESSALVASVAIAEDDRLVAEYTMNNKKTHSQTLLPMLEEIVSAAGTDLKNADAIAISRGPGSFTGLRIGSATAKGLGLALAKPLVEVPTLDSMAFNLYGAGDALICPLMDARRQEVYSGIYEFVPLSRCDAEKQVYAPLSGVMRGEDPLVLTNPVPESAGPVADVIGKLNTYGRPVIFLGDGVPAYADLIAEGMKTAYSFAPAQHSRQRAGSVALLGMRLFEHGITVDAADHAPTYLRVSQAEREKG